MGWIMAVVTLVAPNSWTVNSSPTIAAAIVQAGPNGTIVFGPGTFKITEPIVPLAGQVLVGAGMLATTIIVDFSYVSNFPNMSMIRKNQVNGVCVNPKVTVKDLCVDGGRSQCGRPSATGNNRPEAYGADCPYGYAGGISLGVAWLVSRCRITNVNGPKTACFEAHNSRIEYCLWDNDNGATGGEEDNIGGGGASGLQFVGNTFKENCVGSGIDITTGSNILIDRNMVGFRSIIIEGVIGGTISNNIVARSVRDSDAGSINVKSNTAYGSAQQAGAWCSRNIVIENNIIVNSYSPGIIVSSTWDDKGPGDALDAGRYGKASGIVIRGNIISDAFGLGIYVGGQDRAIKPAHAKIESNTVINLRQASAGLGDEWNSGAGHFKLSGVGIGSGDGVVVQNTSVLKTKAAYPNPVNVVQAGARGGSNVVKNTRVGTATYTNLA